MFKSIVISTRSLAANLIHNNLSIYLLSGLICGIGLAHLGKNLVSPAFGIGISLVMSLPFAGLVLFRKKRPFITLAALFVGFSLLGFSVGIIAFAHPSNHISNLEGQSLAILVKVKESPGSTPWGNKVIVEALALPQCEAMSLSGNAMLYFPDQLPCPTVGDILMAQVKIKPLVSAYPGYLAYLESKDVRQAAFCSHLIIEKEAGTLRSFQKNTNSYLVEQMASGFQSEEMAGLVQAMLLGQRKGLNSDIKEVFGLAGVSHVLAISGLHIALLFIFLQNILSIIKIGRHSKTVQKIFILMILWVYAWLTGFSPAVVRAVIMFSCINLAGIFRAESSGLNNLSFAGFIMLLISPSMLFQVGFQLSFSAVAGILLLSPRLEEMLKKKSKNLPRALLSAISVTLSAQIATFPLIIIHFGSFPTYFLIGNLLILPLVSFAMRAGIIALIICWIPIVGETGFRIMELFLRVITTLSQWIAELPGSEIDSFSWGNPGLWLLVIASLSGFAWLSGFNHLSLQSLGETFKKGLNWRDILPQIHGTTSSGTV